MRFDNKTINKTAEVIRYIDFDVVDEYSAGKLMSLTDFYVDVLNIQKNLCKYYEKTDENVEIALKICNNIVSNCHKISQLKINGSDLIKMGFKGKDIGVALEKTLDLVLKYPQKNNREELLDFAATLIN
jgi:tRNA nucleotidyltransferase (CCA-adding enzyme)